MNHPNAMRDEAPPSVRVGLTGALGAGKSTALRLFAEEGALTFSADESVHRVYARPDIRRALRDRFGDAVLAEDGSVDRGALGEAAQDDPRGLEWLEQLVHPLVLEELERVMREAAPGSVIVCEIPLLADGGLHRRFEYVVSIEAPRETRMRRVADRMDEVSFAQLDARQASREERLSVSDFWFENSGDVGALREFVRSVYEEVRMAVAGGTR